MPDLRFTLRFCLIGLACSLGAAPVRATQSDPLQWAQNLRAFSQLDPGSLQMMKSFSPPKNSLLEGLLVGDVTGDGLADTMLIYRVFPDGESNRAARNSSARVLRIFANEGIAPVLVAQSDNLVFKPYDEALRKDPVLSLETFKGGFALKQQSKAGWVITQTTTWKFNPKEKLFLLDSFSSQANPAESIQGAVVSLSKKQIGRIALSDFSASETDRLFTRISK